MDTINFEKINELIAEKSFEEAKTELEEILNQDGKNVEALKLLGLCNVNLGLFSQGKNNFETVVKYKNDDAVSWFYLANCYDNLEDFLHAKTAYLEVINLRENYLDAYKNLCIIYLKTKELEKAVELGKKVLELGLSPDDYTVYYLIGTAYLAMKDFTGSIEYLEKARELNSNHSQIFNNLGTAYLTIGKYKEACEIYLKAIDLDPKNSITYYNVASILQIQNKHKEACEYFEKAYNLENLDHYLVSLALSEFKSEQFEKAIHHYKMLIAAHPEKHNFQYNLACCYEMVGDYSFAIGILAQLVLLNPKSVTMSQKLANLYLKTNQPLQAKEIYEHIISKGIVSDEIYYEYALICVTTNDVSTAEIILKKVIELNPDSAKAHKDLGVIYLNKRLFDYAEDEFQKAYALVPNDVGIIFEYANFLHATSNFKKAEEFYRKALEISPDEVNIIIFNSMNYIAMNKLEEADNWIEKALKILPKDAFVLFTAGKIKYLMKNFETAKSFLEKSLELNPTNEVKNILALDYFELKEYEKANEIFLLMIKKMPANISLLINSAKCYIGLSDFKSAKTKLKKAQKILPESLEIKEMLDEIKKSV